MGQVSDKSLRKGPLVGQPCVERGNPIALMSIDDFMKQLLDIGFGWSKGGLSQEARHFPAKLSCLGERIDWINRRRGRYASSILGRKFGGRSSLVDRPDFSTSVIDGVLVVVERSRGGGRVLRGFVILQGINYVLNPVMPAWVNLGGIVC